MPQVTQLVDRLVPKIEVKELLDVGVGDGETILSMIGFWGKPIISCCDPEIIPTKFGDSAYHFEKMPYEKSQFFNQEFDIITSLDSLACYTKPEGVEILARMEAKARKMIIVWGPEGYYPYPPFKSCWHAEDFLNRGFCVYKAIDIHQGPPIVASGLLAWKVKT